MLKSQHEGHQENLFYSDLMMQLDLTDPLLRLASVIPWKQFEEEFSQHYSDTVGRPSLPIRMLVGLNLLKYLEDLSDEQVVLQAKRNPYYQAFCGLKEFQAKPLCDASELTHFRKRIGPEGVNRYFKCQ